MTAPSYRVHVDPDKGQGHNRCDAIAPELFDADDLGRSAERSDGLVPPKLLDTAWRAEPNGPEYAISLTEVQP